jgi:cation transporter-like permease
MKQKSNIVKVLSVLTLAFLGGLVGYSLARIGGGASTNPLPLSVILVTLALVFPAFFLVIAWHEGGHAIAGIKVGFDFKMYVVGPFLWEKQGNEWHFKWNRNVNTARGLVVCLPKDTVNLNRKFTIFAASGPIASLLLSVIAYTIYSFFFKNNTTQSMVFEVVGSFFMVTALLSLVVFFATAIPLQSGGFYTDGARVLRLQRGGDTARFESLMLKLIANTSSGVRPKLLNINELEEIQAIGKRLNEPFSVYVHGILHHVAFDNNDTEKAEKYLSDYINDAGNIPDGIRNMVWLDAAFFYAFAKKDLVEAEKFWQQYKPSPMIPKAQILATEAALSFLKNDKETSRLKSDAAIKELPNMIDKGVAIALGDKLNYLKSLI